MRGFFRRRDEPLRRILLIESGPRETGELVLSRLFAPGAGNTSELHCDVLTCYTTAPGAFNPARGKLLSVHTPEATANRRAYVNKLASDLYDAVFILCPGSGVLAKWKWAVAAKSKSRLAIADEYGDWFFVSFSNLGQLAVLVVRRLNLASFPLLFLALAKILIAPFVIAYLALYAAQVHLQRWIRMRKRAIG
ncbi:MAG TPA: hypothetical protein VH351_18080 [Bryobacteraceae bacterium]|jgi:hypothetical protein|nr:hypothetical protein [Bryobacteraceae bacterium]